MRLRNKKKPRSQSSKILAISLVKRNLGVAFLALTSLSLKKIEIPLAPHVTSGYKMNKFTAFADSKMSRTDRV